MLTEAEQQVLVDGWLSYIAMDQHMIGVTNPLMDAQFCPRCTNYLGAMQSGRDVEMPEARALMCENARRWTADMDAAAKLAKAKGRP